MYGMGSVPELLHMPYKKLVMLGKITEDNEFQNEFFMAQGLKVKG